MELFPNNSYPKEGNNFTFLQCSKTSQHYFINISIGFCFGMFIITLTWIITFLCYLWSRQEKKYELNRDNDIVAIVSEGCRQVTESLSSTTKTCCHDQNMITNEMAGVALFLTHPNSTSTYCSELEMGTVSKFNQNVECKTDSGEKSSEFDYSNQKDSFDLITCSSEYADITKMPKISSRYSYKFSEKE